MRGMLCVLVVVLGFPVLADELPVTHAEALSGAKLDFPTALHGKLAVCVFGFSKEAGDRTKVWMTHLIEDGFNAWSVADLEKAPALVRGMIRGSMKKGTPKNQLEHSLILTKDLKAWEQAVGSTQESLPVVVLFDAEGKIVWKHEGAFSDETYTQLKSNSAR